MKEIYLFFILFKSFFMFSEVKGARELIRAFHLDCGRKFFTVVEVKDMIDLLFENNYNYLELAIGNDGMRFLLNDMAIQSKGTLYSSDDVKSAINL